MKNTPSLIDKSLLSNHNINDSRSNQYNNNLNLNEDEQDDDDDEEVVYTALNNSEFKNIDLNDNINSRNTNKDQN